MKPLLCESPPGRPGDSRGLARWILLWGPLFRDTWRMCHRRCPEPSLDINTWKPRRILYESSSPYVLRDTFMGFHRAATTPACKMRQPGGEASADPEPVLEDGTPDFTWGTLRGTLPPLHHLLPAAMRFQRGSSVPHRPGRGSACGHPLLRGGIGIFAIHDMGRFYRHVLLAKRYPPSWRCGPSPIAGKTMYEVFRPLGVWRDCLQPARLPPVSRGESLLPLTSREPGESPKTGLELSRLFFSRTAIGMHLHNPAGYDIESPTISQTPGGVYERNDTVKQQAIQAAFPQTELRGWRSLWPNIFLSDRRSL